MKCKHCLPIYLQLYIETLSNIKHCHQKKPEKANLFLRKKPSYVSETKATRIQAKSKRTLLEEGSKLGTSSLICVSKFFKLRRVLTSSLCVFFLVTYQVIQKSHFPRRGIQVGSPGQSF